MMCWNKKTLGLLALAALAVLAVAPSALGRTLPLLVMLACPLGMLFMARGAAGAARCGRTDKPRAADGTSPEAAQAEIARLRQEVEDLRTPSRGEIPTPSPED